MAISGMESKTPVWLVQKCLGDKYEEYSSCYQEEVLSAHGSEESAKVAVKKLQDEIGVHIDRHNALMGELWRSLGCNPDLVFKNQGCLDWPGSFCDRAHAAHKCLLNCVWHHQWDKAGRCRLSSWGRPKDECKTELELQIWELRHSIFQNGGDMPQYEILGPFEVLYNR